jgi:hypothetical protein
MQRAFVPIVFFDAGPRAILARLCSWFKAIPAVGAHRKLLLSIANQNHNNAYVNIGPMLKLHFFIFVILFKAEVVAKPRGWRILNLIAALEAFIHRQIISGVLLPSLCN